MVEANAKNLILVLVVVIGLAAVVGVLQNKAGLFSVTGEGQAIDTERDSPDPVFNPVQMGCTVVDARSIDSAPEDLGVGDYYALTADHSLTEFGGKVYACQQ